MFRDIPTKPEIEGHYDPRFPDFGPPAATLRGFTLMPGFLTSLE
jgi:hypothetical protein